MNRNTVIIEVTESGRCLQSPLRNFGRFGADLKVGQVVRLGGVDHEVWEIGTRITTRRGLKSTHVFLEPLAARRAS